MEPHATRLVAYFARALSVRPAPASACYAGARSDPDAHVEAAKRRRRQRYLTHSIALPILFRPKSMKVLSCPRN